MKTIGTGPSKRICGLTDFIQYNYLYSDSTYSGLMLSSLEQIIKDKPMFIKNAIIQLGKLKSKSEPYILIEKEQDRYPDVLKTRRCIAGLTSSKQVGTDGNWCGSVLHVVWFDDGDISIEESLLNILPEINWDENAQNFDY